MNFFYLYFCPKKLHTFIKKVKSSKVFFFPKKFNSSFVCVFLLEQYLKENGTIDQVVK